MHLWHFSNGKRKTVTSYTAEAPLEAPDWASLCTCAPWPQGPALPFWLKWACWGAGGSFISSFCLFFYINFWINSPISPSCARNNVESNQVKSRSREQSRWWKLILVPFLKWYNSQKATLTNVCLCTSWPPPQKNFSLEEMHVTPSVKLSCHDRLSIIRDETVAAARHACTTCRARR